MNCVKQLLGLVILAVFLPLVLSGVSVVGKEVPVRISEPFGGVSREWTLTTNDWLLQNGSLTQKTEGRDSKSLSVISLMDAPCRPQRIAVRLSRETEDGYVILCWGAVGPETALPGQIKVYYDVILSGNSLALRKQGVGLANPVVAKEKADFPILGWNDLVVETTSGNEIVIGWNGEELIRWQDEEPLTGQGPVSMRCTPSGYRIDQIDVDVTKNMDSIRLTDPVAEGERPVWQPIIGTWNLEKNALVVAEPLPESGAFIRTTDTWQTPVITFRVIRKAGAIVKIQNKGSASECMYRLIFRENELMAKRVDGTRGRIMTFPDMGYQAVPIDFRPEREYEVKVDASQRDALRVWFDGKLAMEWEYPAQLTPSDILPRGFWTFSTWNGSGRFIDLAISGSRGSMPYPDTESTFVLPETYERLTSEQPVVGGGIDAAAAGANAENIPALSAWEWNYTALPDHGVKAYMPRGECVAYAGITPVDQMPGELRHMSRTLTIYFRVPEAGLYSFLASYGRRKSQPNILEYRLDGTLAWRESYRGAGPEGLSPERKESIPMHLTAGLHTLHLSVTNGWIWPNSFSLKPGIQPACYARSFATQDSDIAKLVPAQDSRLEGGDFLYEISDVPPGQYQLGLLFCEQEYGLPGQRLIRIDVNREMKIKGIDLVQDAGFNTPHWRRFDSVSADADRTIRIRLHGQNAPALLCGVTLARNGKEVFSQNCGFAITREMAFPAPAKAGKERTMVRSHASGPLTKEIPLDGHNLAANPFFTLSRSRAGEKQSKPVAWFEPKELSSPLTKDDTFSDAGSGEFWISDQGSHDAHSRQALYLGKTEGSFLLIGNGPEIAYTDEYEYTGWVKTAGTTGRVWLEIHWFSCDMMETAMKRRKSLLGRLGISKSEALTGDNDWTQLTVKEVPPFGSAFGVIAIRCENNDGDVWVDDLFYDGYDSRPVKIIHSLSGYEPASEKKFLVRARADVAPATFTLTGKDDTQTVRMQGDLKKLRYDPISRRHLYEADLSGLTQSGTFILTAAVGSDTAQTEPFTISPSRYADLFRLSAECVKLKRCGEEVYDWHENLFSDDIRIPLRNRYFDSPPRAIALFDALGGYLDAGDYMTNINHSYFMLDACARAQDTINQREMPGKPYIAHGNPLFSEAERGFRWTLKFFQSPGVWVQGTGFGTGFFTDLIPGTNSYRWAHFSRPLPQLLGPMANFAYRLKQKNPDEEARFIEILRQAWQFNRLSMQATEEMSKPEVWQCLSFDGCMLHADTYLYQCTKDAAFLNDARIRLARILPALQDRVYFSEAYLTQSLPQAGTEEYGHFFEELLGAALFALEFPDDPQAGEIRQQLAVFLDATRGLALDNPYGYLQDFVAPGLKPGDWPMEGYTSKFLMRYARIAALAARALKNADYLTLAEKQLQAMWGKNPRGFNSLLGASATGVASGDYLFLEPEYLRSHPAGTLRIQPGGMSKRALRWFGAINGLSMGGPAGSPPV